MGSRGLRWYLIALALLSGVSIATNMFTLRSTELLQVGLPICRGLDTRIDNLRHDESDAINELRQAVSTARTEAEGAAKQVADMREALASLQETTGKQEEFRRQTTAQLKRIEHTSAEAKRTVEHVDQKVEQVIPTPPPKPSWWRW